jgi:hypothetical protein
MDLVGLVGDFLGRFLVERRRLIARGRIVGGVLQPPRRRRASSGRRFVGGLDAELVGDRLT